MNVGCHGASMSYFKLSKNTTLGLQGLGIQFLVCITPPMSYNHQLGATTSWL